jgi:hypothetical protein
LLLASRFPLPASLFLLPASAASTFLADLLYLNTDHHLGIFVLNREIE